MKIVNTALALITLSVIISTFSPDSQSAEYAVGVQAGRCHTSVYLEMCRGGTPVWHLYARTAQQITEHTYLTASVHHTSRFDGSADLSGDEENQSGTFDAIYGGLEWRW